MCVETAASCQLRLLFAELVFPFAVEVPFRNKPQQAHFLTVEVLYIGSYFNVEKKTCPFYVAYYVDLTAFDYDYDYGPYRGGYTDPYGYNGYFPFPGGDYFYDFPTRGGRGGRSSSAVCSHSILSCVAIY
jgi:hypothetical protein